MNIEGDLLHIDPLSIVVCSCIGFFAILTLLYSWGFKSVGKGRTRYNAYLLLSMATALGAVLANHLVLLLVCWGLSGPFLYLLILFGNKPRTASTAKQAFITIGGSDAVMLFGVVLIGRLSGSFDMQHIRLDLGQPLVVYAFICLLIAVLARVGAIPFHNWLVDTAEDAPTPVTAFLPASTDKLLGIYLLTRMALDLFVMTWAISMMLLVFGAITIIGAGMTMLMQRDLKRLLGYCAVSQVGYILLGIGSGHPLGIAGGLFHMVNHAIYKSCLFFSSGAVEQRMKTTDIEKLGGLARSMPTIFAPFVIAALSVSGVPPLSGFASKWMIYQGIIETAKDGGASWILWLAIAMLGSVLTLAGMMKLVHGVFLGQMATDLGDRDAPGKGTPRCLMIAPLLLALLCILFGVWADGLPLHYLIQPIVQHEIIFAGVWQPTLATFLILLGVGLGLIVYVGSRLSKTMRITEVFIGGETLDAVPGMRVSGGAFYNTIQELPVFRFFYTRFPSDVFSVYRITAKITFDIHRLLRNTHNGLLTTYLSWCLLGMGVLFYVLLFR